TFSAWYYDGDSDGYGDAGNSVTGCSQPSGYVTDNTDCNDGDGSIHPNQSDLCNGIDDDCDFATDEDATFTSWYEDVDGDGFGNAASGVSSCSQPAGYVDNNTDCDDGNPAVNPDAVVACNGIDDNCNNLVDENAISATINPNGAVTFC